jgi:phosphoenolpyruvate-protein phosphotransferase (PTS system enzyme I)
LQKQKHTIVLKGIGVSPGIATGKARLIDHRPVTIARRDLSDPALVEQEIRRFIQSLEEARRELDEIRSKLDDTEGIGPLIIDVHSMILGDTGFSQKTIDIIRDQGVNAEWALESTLTRYRDIFKKMEDAYLKERIRDVEAVVQRVHRHLSGVAPEPETDVNEAIIIVAHDLSPADTVQLKVKKVFAFATDVGGRTSHTAIVARSIGIPAVVGLQNITGEVDKDDVLIVDGTSGMVIINPNQETLRRYEEKKRYYFVMEEDFLKNAHLPAVTRDNHSVGVGANIEFIEEIPAAVYYGANGVGLFRTEFFYVNREQPPTEEEHFAHYRVVVEDERIKWATIRTFDLGGDKFVSDPHLADEMNPAMGLRAIRYCLRERDIFEVQLRGIFRAGVFGNTGIMIPMISGVEEIREVKNIMEKVKGDLRSEGVPFNENIKLGIMIEVPSAVMMADALAQEVDFFSIGTNDLIQYALAIDRVNEHVGYLYKPCHPAVLRLIKHVVDAGHRAGIKVAMCGEMAGDPFCTILLLGLEIDGLSMTPLAIPRVKRIIREAKLSEAKKLLRQVMKFDRTDEVEAHVREYMNRRFADYCIGGSGAA